MFIFRKRVGDMWKVTVVYFRRGVDVVLTDCFRNISRLGNARSDFAAEMVALDWSEVDVKYIGTDSVKTCKVNRKIRDKAIW